MKTHNSFSKFQETGFVCEFCSVQTKTYDGKVPVQCPSCGSANLKKIWDQMVSITAKIEPIES